MEQIPKGVIPDLIREPCRFVSVWQDVRRKSVRAWIAGASPVMTRRWKMQLFRPEVGTDP